MKRASAAFLRIIWTDSVTGRNGYVVIDRLIRGIAGGGLRVRRGVTLEEIERLAVIMTYKKSVLGIPVGGAKGGLDCDLSEPGGPEVLIRFVRAMRPIFETYWVTGPDLGVSREDLESAFERAGLGRMAITVAGLKSTEDPRAAMERIEQGLASRSDGTTVLELIGGYGVAQAAIAALEYLHSSINGSRVVIQGFGSMGSSTAVYLARAGAKVVGIVDARGAVVNDDGLDVEVLARTRSGSGEVDRGHLRSSDQERERDAWLSIDADVLIPAAVADVINAENCDEVRTKLVVEAANIPTTDEADHRLYRRGVVIVPDLVANAGVSGWWWQMLLAPQVPNAEAAFQWASRAIPDAVRRLLALADEQKITPREAARRLALSNVEALVRDFGGEVAIESVAQGSV
jgi:glutamate dehydrogenase (NAD(P)+)